MRMTSIQAQALARFLDKTRTACGVEGCAKPLRCGGFCAGHYNRLVRYGSPEGKPAPRYPDLTGQRFGTLTALRRAPSKMWVCSCDCGAEVSIRADSLASGQQTCGDATVHSRRKGRITYTAAHYRVRADRGQANRHLCLDCGKPAHHWSYDHTDPDELFDYHISKNPVAYSVDTARYDPRCRSCHRFFDQRAIAARRSASWAA